MFFKKQRQESNWTDDFVGYNKLYTEPFGEKGNDGDNNIILTENVFLSLDDKITKRNANVMVVGSAGTGKSRHFLKPNILQANCNFVITDPYGDILKETRKFLQSNGYQIQVLDLNDIDKSNKYNPFDHIQNDDDARLLASVVIKNTLMDCTTSLDNFFERLEEELLLALIYYLRYYRPKEEHNFTNVIKLIEKLDYNPESKCELEIIFDELERNNPTSIAVKQYKTFQIMAGKSKKSIATSLLVKLSIFNVPQTKELTETNEIDLNGMDKDKKALFIIAPISNTPFACISTILISQLTNILNNSNNERHVRLLIDDFGSFGYIKDLDMKMATARMHNYSFSLVIQSISQIKSTYPADWEAIVANCDSFLYLGGRDYVTMEYVSKALGTRSLSLQAQQPSFNMFGNKNQCYQPTRLMSEDELGTIQMNDCILIIRGLKPFKDKKFDYTKHKNYKYIQEEK